MTAEADRSRRGHARRELLEFGSKDDALRCYASDEYAPLKALRHSGATSEMFVIGE